MARKARVEGAVSVPAAAEDFASFVQLFKDEHPDEWEALRLCPLESGLVEMAKLI